MVNLMNPLFLKLATRRPRNSGALVLSGEKAALADATSVLVRGLALAALVASSPVVLASCPVSGGAIEFNYASEKAPLLVVTGRIDGEEATVVVDTGGSAPFDVFLSPRQAQKHELVLSEEITPPDTTAVGPSRQTYRTTTLPKFSLGPVHLSNLNVAVVPMIDAMEAQVGRRIDAIVGQQFLRGRRVMIDYGRRILDLQGLEGSSDDAIAFTFAARKPLLLIPVIVNGQGPFQMEIDTGATRTSLSPDAARRAGIAVSGSGVLVGAGGPVSVALGEAELRLASVTRRTPIAVTPSIEEISRAAGSSIDGILGTDFLADTCLAIDYPGEKVWIMKSENPSLHRN